MKHDGTYIVSECNREAHATCMAVVTEGGPRFIAIGGPSFCGKTYLLTTVERAYRCAHSDKTVCAVSCADVMPTYINALKNTEPAAFDAVCGECDVLLVDNMQELVGKPATQQEWGQWFADLLDDGKQVVIAFDCEPSALEPLLAVMRDRHASVSAVVAMKEADAVLRAAYWEQLCAEADLPLCADLPIQCAPSMAAMTGWVRKLEMLREQNGGVLTEQDVRVCLEETL